MRSTVVLSVLCLVPLAQLASVEFHVSPTGRDGHPGTRAQPFGHLEAARDAVRGAPDRGKEPITVWLAPGRYVHAGTLAFGPQDSGTEAAPVIYKALGGPVFLDGGRVIPASACRPVSDAAVRQRLLPEAVDRILQIDLKEQGITDYGAFGPRGFRRAYKPAALELFIDGRAMTVARWPNAGQAHLQMGKVHRAGSVPRKGDFGMQPGEFEYGVDRAKRWTQADDLYVSGLFCYGYADDTIPVAKLDTAKGTITTKLPHLYGFKSSSLSKWFALNLIEEIDVPGEYALDRGRGVLYFIPPEGVKMEGALIQVSMLEEVMLAFEDASHVRFEGITFENMRGSAAYIERGSGVRFAGCTFRNLGMLAVQMGQGTNALPEGRQSGHGQVAPGIEWKPASRIMGNWHEYIYEHTAWNRNAGTRHGLLSCEIRATGAGGVILGGGDRKTLTPAGNYVENCEISDVNRLDRTYKAAINLCGVGNRITNNHIHDCEGQAVYLHGNDHLIERNRIERVCRDISDMGAIYMGRDPSESGNVIRHNVFHDIRNFHQGGHGVQAIFFDDCCTFGATVEGNLFVKTGSNGVIKFNGGGASPVINNLFVDGPAPVIGHGAGNTKRVRSFMKGELGQQRLRKNVDILAEPYASRYPILKEIYEERRNVDLPFERNHVAAKGAPEFLNAQTPAFRLPADAPVFRAVKGFEPIPFEKIGLQPDEFRKAQQAKGSGDAG